MPGPSVFLSYSHEDEVWMERLRSHLAVLERQGRLETWDDRRIGGGADWREEIRSALEGAQVAVLLVSADFLTSNFILDVEVERLLERRAKEGVHILPVIVKACTWKQVPWLAAMHVRPKGGKPLATFRSDQRDSELVKIAEEVLELIEGKALRQPISPPSALPQPLHQIPPPPGDFTGREQELADLREALRAGGATISGLRGAGGIGKTALALRLAEELEPLYPDAQLYLDLKGVSQQPLTTAQAMAHVIRAYHPTAQLPEGEEALAGLYFSVLHGQRVLLLMDNAANRQQVEPLIPPAGCTLLVTSRFHFALPGIVTKDLDELPQDDAEALLRSVAPRIGEAAEQVAALCGRLPLALRLAGSALAEKAWLSPGDYANRLTETKGERLGLIEASLATSYDLLNKKQRKRWRRLAVFPGSFDAAGAAAVWEVEVDSARDALGELIGASLVEYEGERYRLHDLARVFADSHLSGTERESARRRHSVHYERVLSDTSDLYLKGGASLLAGLALFDAEWGNVKAGQSWAAARAAEDTQAGGLCSDYPDAGVYCLSLRLHPREQIAWLDSALAAARSGQDRKAEGNHLGNLGLAYVDLGEPRCAIDHFEQDLVIMREIGYRRGEGSALGNLGIAYKDLGEPRRAIELYERQLAIVREIGDRRGEGNALGNLGLAYANLEEPRRAIEHYEQALVIDREIGDRHGEGATLGNLGLAYADLGEPRRAIEHYEQALVIDRGIGDRHGEGTALGNLGLAYADLGEPRRAIEHYEQARAIAREIGDRVGEANTCWYSGLIYEQEGDLARAADLMQVLVDYERSIGHPDSEKYAAHLAALRARIE